MASGLFFRFCTCLFLLGSTWLSAAYVDEAFEKVSPYLLPQDHPIKRKLDTLFSEARVTLSLKSLQEAGFKKARPNPITHLIVTTHPEMPGYVFKIYLDAQRYYKDLPEHEIWLMRIEGAEKVRQILDEEGLHDRFKVPQKWIYPLPHEPKPPTGYLEKFYILVAEDMDILSKEENEAVWASDVVTQELLNQLSMVLKEAGLADGAKPDNIPFSKDGRIAFVDTQTHGAKRVRFSKLVPFLSEENQGYWKSLFKKR